eukprot:355604-Chlamydomonas_euryale.AAC.2
MPFADRSVCKSNFRSIFFGGSQKHASQPHAQKAGTKKPQPTHQCARIAPTRMCETDAHALPQPACATPTCMHGSQRLHAAECACMAHRNRLVLDNLQVVWVALCSTARSRWPQVDKLDRVGLLLEHLRRRRQRRQGAAQTTHNATLPRKIRHAGPHTRVKPRWWLVHACRDAAALLDGMLGLQGFGLQAT